jgi:hypothetical protein
VGAAVCARQHVPSSPREPLLAGAFARSPGTEARRRIRAWAAVVAARLGDLGFQTEPAAIGGASVLGAAIAGESDSAPGEPWAMRFVLARAERGDTRAGARRAAAGDTPNESPAESPSESTKDHRRAARGRVRDDARVDRARDARALIAFSIDEGHVEVAVELSIAGVPADRARIGDPLRALELTTTLEALPEQFEIGIVGDDCRAPASRASTDQLRALFDRAEREQRPLWLGWSVPREVAVAHATLLEEQLEDAAIALGSALTVLSRPPDGSGASRAPAASPRHDRRRRSAGDDEVRGAKRRAVDRDDDRERPGARAADPEAREHDGPAKPAHRVLQRVPSAHAKPRVGGRTRRGRGADGSGSSGALEKGTRVRVLEGPFSGKVGVVQELDGKGGARVMLGLLAVRLDVRDLARSAEGRHRPVLSTSHRKPPPVRS